MISAIGLVVLAPFLPLIALLIKLDSKGPVFYRPERLGIGEGRELAEVAMDPDADAKCVQPPTRSFA